MVSRRLQIVGLALLAALTVGLSMLALPGFRAGYGSPAAPIASAAPAVTQLPTPSPTTATDSPISTPSTTKTPPRRGLAGLADLLASKEAASVLVLGDGSGDATDEWVRVWAVRHAMTDRQLTYRAWDAGAVKWRVPNPKGGTNALTIWNASRRAPDLRNESSRVAQVWRPADVVLLSYGHRKTADTITAGLSSIRKAVLKQNPDANIIVMIQNPDPVASHYVQLETTGAVKKWAKAAKLESVDIFQAFVDAPTPRSVLVESDGSPTATGSQLWAKTLQAAIIRAA